MVFLERSNSGAPLPRTSYQSRAPLMVAWAIGFPVRLVNEVAILQ